MRLGAGSIKLSAFIEFIPPPDPSPEESFQSANNSFAGTGGGGGGGALRHACPIYYIFHVWIRKNLWRRKREGKKQPEMDHFIPANLRTLTAQTSLSIDDDNEDKEEGDRCLSQEYKWDYVIRFDAA